MASGGGNKQRSAAVFGRQFKIRAALDKKVDRLRPPEIGSPKKSPKFCVLTAAPAAMRYSAHARAPCAAAHIRSVWMWQLASGIREFGRTTDGTSFCTSERLSNSTERHAASADVTTIAGSEF
jgi:hypothetical protein